MKSDIPSRRALLQALAATAGAAALPFGWAEIAEAAWQTRAAGHSAGAAALGVLTVAEAADVEAIAAQIIPTIATIQASSPNR